MTAKGHDLPQAKLNPDLVRQIRRNQHGWTARQWAEHLGLHSRTIESVTAYRTWKHVTIDEIITTGDDMETNCTWIEPLIEDSPCDGCPLWSHCKAENTACAKFLWYVEKGDTPKELRKTKDGRKPTKEIYNYIYSGLEKINTGRKNTRGLPIYCSPPELINLRRLAVRSVKGWA